MNRNRTIWTTLTTFCTLIGAVVGYVISSYYSQVTIVNNRLIYPNEPIRDQLVPFWTRPALPDQLVPPNSVWPLFIVLTLGFAVIFTRIGSWLADHLVGLAGRAHSMSAVDRVLAIIGALLGMIFGVLLTLPLANRASEQGFWLFVQFCALVVSSVLGLWLMMGMRSEMLRAFPQLDAEASEEESYGSVPKLLDTNIIIDGRIAQLCKTGFLEGPLIVPSFVLDEVQYIADAPDPLRRARGQRGLEVLNNISQITVPRPGADRPKDETMPLVRVQIDIPQSVRDVKTVDGKLVALAREMRAAIITNDFNLNSVAKLQGVPVLNLNELAQSLKPVVLPGEELDLRLEKEGNQAGQAVGYLSDGTMVVVGDASRYIGTTCRVIIDKVIQTVTGKMIFAELKKNPDTARELRSAGDDLFDEAPHSNGHEHSVEPAHAAHNGKKRR